MKLYIIRHAETEYNRKGIIQGSEVDSDINDAGENQANSFYEYYKDINFDKIYVSDLKRTFQTIRRFTENGSLYEKIKDSYKKVTGFDDCIFILDKKMKIPNGEIFLEEKYEKREVEVVETIKVEPDLSTFDGLFIGNPNNLAVTAA